MNDDELNAIKKLLRDTPMPTDGNAKKRAINSALVHFDEKNKKTSQGMGWLDRLIGTTNHYRGRFSMKHAYAIAGTFCVAIFATTLLSTTTLMPPKKHEFDAGVAQTVNVQGPSVPPATPQNKAAEFESVSKDLKKQSVPAFIPPAMPEPLAVAEAAADLAAPQAMRAEGSAAGNAAPAMARAKMVPQGLGYAGVIAPSPMPEPMPYVQHDEGRDKFSDIKTNATKVVAEEPVSTFSIDVDTASYSFVRSALNNNQLPQKDAVRVEEMVNYFPYDYAHPTSKEVPFKANVSVMDTPWNKGTKLMHVGIKGYEIEGERPRANLVFLLDTSGSMMEPNKLPLVQNSLKLMLDSMEAEDTIAIVTYAGSAGTALEPTKVKDKAKIIAAIDNLMAGGSTAGAEGIRQAYQLAEQNFDKNGVNRILLATDGDFNVGITDETELKSFIERKRESGIFLSVLGFGRGNYNDALMQTLAQNGNGNAAYIDNLNEARKALVEESTSTLFPIAKDVKIQVEFNPATVAEYRLIGYETRMLNREDFNNDKVDAGDIGSGHTVTALYEITPKGSDAKLVDDLRYGKADEAKASKGDEYAFVKIRYKQPNASSSKLITTAVTHANDTALKGEPAFAAAVAAFGQLLRGDAPVKDFTYDDVIELAQANKGNDPFGYRAEFINLVRMAKNAPAMAPLGQQ